MDLDLINGIADPGVIGRSQKRAYIDALAAGGIILVNNRDGQIAGSIRLWFLQGDGLLDGYLVAEAAHDLSCNGLSHVQIFRNHEHAADGAVRHILPFDLRTNVKHNKRDLIL